MRKRGPYRKKLPKERFWKYVEKKGPDECWEWMAHTVKGYGRFWSGQKDEYSHRMAFYLKNGHWPDKNICHKCDNPLCVNPNHLWEGSQQENMRDMVQKGRWNGFVPSGDKNHKAKLTWENVKDIREKYKKGKTQKELRLEYDISKSQISKIVRGKSWK